MASLRNYSSGKQINTVQNKIINGLNDLESNKYNFDNFLKFTQSVGTYKRAMTYNLYGINHRNLVSPIPLDKNNQGLVFFTRPQLNLTSKNLFNMASFVNLATTDRFSIFRYIRNLLDPRSCTRASLSGGGCNPVTQSPYLFQELIFMPVLTNSLKSLSGWPDPSLPVYKSKENLRGGVWGAVDGIMQTYGSYDFSCTFRNYVGNPIFAIFYYWLKYMSAVYDGTMIPYMDMLGANELDYNTRIYRLVLDSNKKYVKMISCTGASMPTSIDIGRFFNYNESPDVITEHSEISVTFTNFGACYLDNIIIDEFNKAVCIGQPSLNSIRNIRLTGKSMTDAELDKKLPGGFPLEKIPYNLLRYFNFKGYPFINTDTLELEWWIEKNSPYLQMFKKLIK